MLNVTEIKLLQLAAQNLGKSIEIVFPEYRGRFERLKEVQVSEDTNLRDIYMAATNLSLFCWDELDRVKGEEHDEEPEEETGEA